MAKQISFYFSGAQNLNLPQLDINSSLGGFISNTPLPKGLINSLFSPLSNFDMANSTTDTIAIFIKNTGDEAIEELSILEVYQQLLNVETNQSKFEFAAVAPNSSGYIELIGSRKEYPYYADFFEPKYKREEAILKILTAGVEGDVVDLLDVEIILSGNTVESVVDDIISIFVNNTDFLVGKISHNEVYIRRKSIVLTGIEVDLITPGTATAAPVNLQGLDDSYIIAENLAIDGFLGLWIKRSIIEEKISCNSSDEEKVENVEVIFSF